MSREPPPILTVTKIRRRIPRILICGTFSGALIKTIRQTPVFLNCPARIHRCSVPGPNE